MFLYGLSYLLFFLMRAARSFHVVAWQDLPAFLRRIVWGEGIECGEPSSSSALSPGSPRKLLSLTHVAACADWSRLAQVLLTQCDDTPWMLQPLVNAAPLVNGALTAVYYTTADDTWCLQLNKMIVYIVVVVVASITHHHHHHHHHYDSVPGMPGFRVVHLLRKLRSAAEALGTAQAAAVVALTTQQVLFVSLAHRSGPDGPFDCVWHHSMDEHEELLWGVQLPLALMHASPTLLQRGARFSVPGLCSVYLSCV